MPRKDAPALAQVCPGISIHAIDIVQPPGIDISPMADMDAHQTIVSVVLTTNISVEIPKKASLDRSQIHKSTYLPATLLAAMWTGISERHTMMGQAW